MDRNYRALLIGSGYAKLPGTDNDVKRMSKMLEEYNFDPSNQIKLYGKEATRKNILCSWEKLISQCSKNDAVVIYYSGHGGLAEKSSENSRSGHHRPQQEEKAPVRIQFLLPIDYEPDADHWTGIFDAELSKLLFDTTQKTRNVTYILDCCHASRLGRAPEGFKVWNKSYTDGEYDKILKFRSSLHQETLLEGDAWANPSVVRIYAAADHKQAWQYKKQGLEVGIFTDQLIRVMSGQKGQSSWNNLMSEVRALINQLYEKSASEEPQRPRSAGADSRKPFSMDIDWSRVFIARKIKNNQWLIEGGKLHGIVKDSEFVLSPFSPDNNHESDKDPATSIMTIENVDCFASEAETNDRVKYKIGIARLKRMTPTFKMYCPEDLSVDRLLDKTGVFAQCASEEDCDVRIVTEEIDGTERLQLYGKRSVLLKSVLAPATENEIERLLSVARRYIQGEHLRQLSKGTGLEQFDPKVSIEIGKIHNRAREPIYKVTSNDVPDNAGENVPQPIVLEAGDQFDIHFESVDKCRVFVFAFRVDAAGNITYLSGSHENGVEVSDRLKYRRLDRSLIGESRASGMTMEWPRSIPMPENSSGLELDEEFVFLFTLDEADLRGLESSTGDDFIVSTKPRGREATATYRPNREYDVVHVPYRLKPWSPNSVSESAISLDGEEESEDSEIETPTAARGGISAAFRRCRGVPLGVRVVNLFREEIKVQVAPYRPLRLWTGVGIGASSSGAQVDIETTTYVPKTVEKTLTPRAHDVLRSVATFNLPNSGDGFATISILTTPESHNIINDRVPLGSTVYFNGTPDLDSDEYNGSGERHKYRPIREFPQ